MQIRVSTAGKEIAFSNAPITATNPGRPPARERELLQRSASEGRIRPTVGFGLADGDSPRLESHRDAAGCFKN